MKVILLQDVENLGDEGEIVAVKPGYGRNYLIPQGLATMATKGEIKRVEEERRQQVRKRAQMRENAEELQKELEKTEVVVEAKVGEENRIFGTVTAQQVAVKLAMQGFSIERRQIELSEDIRVIGVYTAHVKLFTDVIADVTVRVIPEGGEVAPAEEEAEATAEAPEAPAETAPDTPEAAAEGEETPEAEKEAEADA